MGRGVTRPVLRQTGEDTTFSKPVLSIAGQGQHFALVVTGSAPQQLKVGAGNCDCESPGWLRLVMVNQAERRGAASPKPQLERWN